MSTEYTLQLQSLPSALPSPIRLRRVLKSLLRTYAFRCTSVSQADVEAPKCESSPSVAASGSTTPLEAK